MQAVHATKHTNLDDEGYGRVSGYSDATRDVAVFREKQRRRLQEEWVADSANPSLSSHPELPTLSSGPTLASPSMNSTQEDQALPHQPLRRANSWSEQPSQPLHGVPPASAMALPGGFRREFLAARGSDTSISVSSLGPEPRNFTAAVYAMCKTYNHPPTLPPCRSAQALRVRSC